MKLFFGFVFFVLPIFTRFLGYFLHFIGRPVVKLFFGLVFFVLPIFTRFLGYFEKIVVFGTVPVSGSVCSKLLLQQQ